MKPIPEDAPEELARLARTLRELREKTGNLPLADLAHDAHLAKSTLHHALSGERLPSQEIVLLFVDVCSRNAGVSPEPLREQTMRLWREARQAIRPSDSAAERPSAALELWRRRAATPRRTDGADPTRPGTVSSAEDDVTIVRYYGHGNYDQDDLAALRLRRVHAEREAGAAMARLHEAVAAAEAAQAALRVASEAERDALERANAENAEAGSPSSPDIPASRAES
ncbi:helix-turn-helix domain-containing protein [Streptomyces sp. NPDC002209]|uniref:helix-turn-helix domain-containing protein n=1 Tax=Streptomyces sp. NPDC002209 TaxID=3364638 RepID=UPI0036CA520E